MLALSFVRTDVATDVMFWSDWVFLALFTLEMLLKMLGLGLRCFQAVVWNRFDMFLVLGSILLQALFAASASPLRIVHVTRMAKVVHAVRALRSYVLVAADCGLHVAAARLSHAHRLVHASPPHRLRLVFIVERLQTVAKSFMRVLPALRDTGLVLVVQCSALEAVATRLPTLTPLYVHVCTVCGLPVCHRGHGDVCLL